MSGTAWLFLGCLVVGWMVVRSKPTGGAVKAGRAISVRGHAHGSGGRQMIAVHEAGHAVAARAIGGRVLSAS